MTSPQKFFLFILRLSMGWMFFYAGIAKVLDPAWSAAGYLKGATFLPWLYQIFSQPHLLPYVDFANKWGLTLLGISLMLGLFVRLSSLLGVILMALYYFAIPGFNFPHPNAHSYIVDEHVIYIAVLFFFAAIKAGRFLGADGKRAHHESGFRKWLG